jgi:hypothetical protein
LRISSFPLVGRLSKQRFHFDPQIHNPQFAIRNPGARGTASAEHKTGKHETKRAPAAITSLSAASRCASRPPSDPSV